MNALRIAVLAMTLAVPGASQTPPPRLSAAQVAISRTQQAVVEDPENHEHYNDLAFALARRAAETADADYYALAEGALEESFRLAPRNRQAERVRGWIAQARLRFETRRAAAEALREVRCGVSTADDQFPNAATPFRPEDPELQPRIAFSGRSEDQ